MPTILVVEDDPVTRNFIVQVLTGEGFRVFEADTATEAMLVCQSLQGHPLDVVITDHFLGKSSGRELAEQILQGCPNIKILHLSSIPFDQMQHLAAIVPGGSFLQKPFTGGQLAEIVRTLISPRTH